MPKKDLNDCACLTWPCWRAARRDTANSESLLLRCRSHFPRARRRGPCQRLLGPGCRRRTVLAARATPAALGPGGPSESRLGPAGPSLKGTSLSQIVTRNRRRASGRGGRHVLGRPSHRPAAGALLRCRRRRAGMRVRWSHPGQAGMVGGVAGGRRPTPRALRPRVKSATRDPLPRATRAARPNSASPMTLACGAGAQGGGGRTWAA